MQRRSHHSAKFIETRSDATENYENFSVQNEDALLFAVNDNNGINPSKDVIEFPLNEKEIKGLFAYEFPLDKAYIGQHVKSNNDVFRIFLEGGSKYKEKGGVITDLTQFTELWNIYVELLPAQFRDYARQNTARFMSSRNSLMTSFGRPEALDHAFIRVFFTGLERSSKMYHLSEYSQIESLLKNYVEKLPDEVKKKLEQYDNLDERDEFYIKLLSSAPDIHEFDRLLPKGDPIAVNENYEELLLSGLDNGYILPKFYDENRIQQYLIEKFQKLEKSGVNTASRIIRVLESDVSLYNKLKCIANLSALETSKDLDPSIRNALKEFSKLTRDEDIASVIDAAFERFLKKYEKIDNNISPEEIKQRSILEKKSADPFDVQLKRWMQFSMHSSQSVTLNDLKNIQSLISTGKELKSCYDFINLHKKVLGNKSNVFIEFLEKSALNLFIPAEKSFEEEFNDLAYFLLFNQKNNLQFIRKIPTEVELLNCYNTVKKDGSLSKKEQSVFVGLLCEICIDKKISLDFSSDLGLEVQISQYNFPGEVFEFNFVGHSIESEDEAVIVADRTKVLKRFFAINLPFLQELNQKRKNLNLSELHMLWDAYARHERCPVWIKNISQRLSEDISRGSMEEFLGKKWESSYESTITVSDDPKNKEDITEKIQRIIQEGSAIKSNSILLNEKKAELEVLISKLSFKNQFSIWGNFFIATDDVGNMPLIKVIPTQQDMKDCYDKVQKKGKISTEKREILVDVLRNFDIKNNLNIIPSSSDQKITSDIDHVKPRDAVYHAGMKVNVGNESSKNKIKSTQDLITILNEYENGTIKKENSRNIEKMCTNEHLRSISSVFEKFKAVQESRQYFFTPYELPKGMAQIITKINSITDPKGLYHHNLELKITVLKDLKDLAAMKSGDFNQKMRSNLGKSFRATETQAMYDAINAFFNQKTGTIEDLVACIEANAPNEQKRAAVSPVKGGSSS